MIANTRRSTTCQNKSRVKVILGYQLTAPPEFSAMVLHASFDAWLLAWWIEFVHHTTSILGRSVYTICARRSSFVVHLDVSSMVCRCTSRNKSIVMGPRVPGYVIDGQTLQLYNKRRVEPVLNRTRVSLPRRSNHLSKWQWNAGKANRKDVVAERAMERLAHAQHEPRTPLMRGCNWR